ncbi:MAG TPA: SAM-dependent chlorinase/fluorinase [Solirubrobacteraceae bacterium]|nr:SAM-dependent chlorinase/fluorinase [Solirubrobacteraceae bacterium]
MSAPVITFLSDYGLEDDFVGVCHGVIATICPRARVIDITHGLPRHDVLAGATVLRNVLPYMPAGVHLAVVDPDVGAGRRAIALLLADGRYLVGPDNGLLSLAAAGDSAIVEAADIGRSAFRLAPTSATFHGRDIFAPVAAHLAAGASLADAGTPLDPAELVEVTLPRPERDGDALVAHVVYIDHFGNVELDVHHEDLTGSGLKLGRRVVLGSRAESVSAQFARTFADVAPGELLVYEDAYRTLAVAVSGGDAAARLGLTPGDELRIRPA